MPKRIAIIGAGTAGLTLAYYLAQDKSHQVCIFEKTNKIGGMIQTIQIGSLQFSPTTHNFVLNEPDSVESKKFIEQYTGPMFKYNAVHKVNIEGKYYDFPIQNNLGQLSLIDRWHCRLSYLLRNKNLDVVTLSDYFHQIYGRKIAKWLIAYNQKNWKVSLNMVAPADTLLQRNIWTKKNYRLQEHYLPKGGLNVFHQNLYGELKHKNNVCFHFNCNINRVILEHKQIYHDNNNEQFDIIYNTAPLKNFINLIGNNYLYDRINKLYSLPMVVTYVALDKYNSFNVPKNTQWIYFFDSDCKLTRANLSYPYDKRLETNRLIFTQTTYDEAFKDFLHDSTFIMNHQLMVIDTLRKYHIIDGGTVHRIGSWVWPTAYMIRLMNTQAILDEIRQYLLDYNIHLFGSFAEWSYHNVDQVINRIRKHIKESKYV